MIAAPARTQSIGDVLQQVGQARTFRQAAVSPDGKRVAWVEAEGSNSAIYAPERIKTGGGFCDEHSIAWSPDSTRLAFLSDRGNEGQLELWVADPAAPAKSARKLTNLTGYLADPRWSPDGKQIAVLFTEGAPRAAGPLEPVTPDSGVVESKIYYQRLALVDAASGKVRQISPPDLYVYEYDWSGDSRRLAYTAAPGPGDDNWFIAQLYTIDAASGAARHVYKPPLQIAVPRFSPDGGSIAFIGGLMSDEGVTGGDVFQVAAGGGEARNLTPQRKSSPAWIRWLTDGRLLVTESAGGGAAISILDPKSGESKTLWEGDEAITAGAEALSLSVARDEKTTALIRNSWRQPPEVWEGEIGKWRPVTHANKGLKPLWGEARSIEWKNDGFSVEGWLLFPRDYNPARRYPMVVSVHGGPASSVTPRWPRTFFDLSILSTQGYFVFFPNPRGSFGQGEAFTRANVKDFGYGDLRDILAGVDRVVKEYPIDERKLAIAGWSYGGYMTMWAVTQTNRFHAAVAGAGLSDWQSYYGENSIDQWMIPYFGASVYDDPEVYARSAPITFIKNVKTPTLVLVGAQDGECPAPQSYEFWHALKTLGVKTQLVVYPGEGHMFHSPEHIRDLLERTVRWFGDNLP